MLLGGVIYLISDDMFGDDFSPMLKFTLGVIAFIVCLFVSGLVPVR